jgi:transcriptional regulator with XRE-family HTH domain
MDPYGYGDTFADQLRCNIMYCHLTQRKLAEYAGVKFQSISRLFTADPERQAGLEGPVLESIFKCLGLCVGRKAGPVSLAEGVLPRSSAAQLRLVILASGIRPSRIAKEAGISKSVLSLFLSGKRDGLSLAYIERLWSYLGLKIVSYPYGFATEGTRQFSGRRVWVDNGEPF